MGGRPLDHLSARNEEDEGAEKGTLSSPLFFKRRNFCRYFLASFIPFASRAMASLSRAHPETDSTSETVRLMMESSRGIRPPCRSLQRADAEWDRLKSTIMKID